MLEHRFLQEEVPLNYLGIQPIVDWKGDIVAHEVLYRNGDIDAAAIKDPVTATSSVISSLLSQLGLIQMECQGRVFVNIDRDLLFYSHIELLPPAYTTLEILETIVPDAAVVERCRHLVEMGYSLALDDFVFDDVHACLIPLASIIKIDVKAQGVEDAVRNLERIRAVRQDVVFLAEKVETREEFEQLKRCGFSLFQGYFFAKPQLRTSRHVGPSPITTLQALEIVIRDGEMSQVESLLKRDPGLTLGVLRLANSVAYSSRNRTVETIRHALLLLGQRQLRRYLEIVILARHATNMPRAILQLMIARANFMEYVAQQESLDGSAAYLVGMLSLADRLLGLSMEQIIAALPLSKTICMALMKRQGRLGELLFVCEALESGIGNCNIALPSLSGGQRGQQWLAAWSRALCHAANLPSALQSA